MKAKKIRIAVVLALSLVAVFCVNTASAETLKFYVCQIEELGVNETTMYVVLTHVSTSPAFTKMSFRIPENNDKYFVATVLTAQGSALQVRVAVDPTITDQRLRYLRQIYLLNQ
jgi:hypothetical protein